MARSYGVLKVSMWEPGSDFRQLSPMAQWAYTMLLSQPQISNLGLLAYTPEKWVRLAAGLTTDVLDAAIGELEDTRYVMVDRDTGELLVRTFIKHDRIYTQPALTTNARQIVRSVESDPIRTYLLDRHAWLDGNSWFADAPEFTGADTREKKRNEWAWDKAKIEAYEARMSARREPDETPLDTPLGGHFFRDTEPSREPVEGPQGKGLGLDAGEGVGSGTSAVKALRESTSKGFTAFPIPKLREVS